MAQLLPSVRGARPSPPRSDRQPVLPPVHIDTVVVDRDQYLLLVLDQEWSPWPPSPANGHPPERRGLARRREGRVGVGPEYPLLSWVREVLRRVREEPEDGRHRGPRVVPVRVDRPDGVDPVLDELDLPLLPFHVLAVLVPRRDEAVGGRVVVGRQAALRRAPLLPELVVRPSDLLFSSPSRVSTTTGGWHPTPYNVSAGLSTSVSRGPAPWSRSSSHHLRHPEEPTAERTRYEEVPRRSHDRGSGGVRVESGWACSVLRVRRWSGREGKGPAGSRAGGAVVDCADTPAWLEVRRIKILWTNLSTRISTSCSS